MKFVANSVRKTAAGQRSGRCANALSLLLVLTVGIGLLSIRDARSADTRQSDPLERNPDELNFEIDFDYVIRIDVTKFGRDQKFAAYQKLFDKYPNAKRKADVMMEIANLLGSNYPVHGIQGNPAEELKWFRLAAKTAEPGTKTWNNVHFILAYHAQKDEQEFSSILDSIEKNAANNSLTLARVELERFLHDIRAGRINEAEKRMKTLRNWYLDGSRVPKNSDDKFELDQVIRNPVSVMAQAYLTAPLPKADRKKKIESLQIYGGNDYILFQDIEETLTMLDQFPEFQPVPPVNAAPRKK